MSTQLFTGFNYLNSNRLHSVLSCWWQFPCLPLQTRIFVIRQFQNCKLVQNCRLFSGLKKFSLGRRSWKQIYVIHNPNCKPLLCDQTLHGELCEPIYYSLLLESHTVHNWWQGIWEMYECCNLLLAPSKAVKLIKCGAGWRLSHFNPYPCLETWK